MELNFKIEKKEFVARLILLILIVAYLLSFFVYGNEHEKVSFWIYISFVPTGIICIYELINDKLDVSLNKMHWYFVLIFLVLSPISQIRSGYCPWRFSWSEGLILRANVIVLLWSIVYILAYKRVIKLKTKGEKRNAKEIAEKDFSDKKRKGIRLLRSSKIILLFISILSVILMIRIYGFNNLFIRGSEGFGDNTFGIMFDYLLRSIPVINCAIFILDRKQNGCAKISEIITLFVCVLLVNSPIVLSRYWSGVVYLGLLVCIIPRKWIEKKRFDIIILSILLVVFPAFSIFKNNTFQEALQKGQRIEILTVYNSVDFDAYSLLCQIIQFVIANGLTWGSQLRSVIFFFVPRAIWNIKGVPTGQLVATWLNSFFTNVSSPLMGEGLIDFGLIGVVLYAFVFGRVLRKFDSAFEEHRHEEKDDNVLFINIISPFLLGFTIFIMRGALQSVFLRIMGFFLYLMIVYFIKETFNLFIKRRF